MDTSVGLFKTSVVRKNVMAITGLFITFFLVIHLAGNLLLLLPDSFFPVEFWGGVANVHDMYNGYSHFLVHFWPITVVAWVLYAGLIIHAVDALIITLHNNKAKGEKYQVKDYSTSTWYSRNMGSLGVVIGLFIILHMAQFWLQYKVLKIEHDLYELVVATFKQWWYVVLYELGILALFFHLIHGVQSAHRSLGFFSPRLMSIIQKLAFGFVVILCVLYAIIPIVLYFK